MPTVHHAWTRKREKQQRVIPGEKSLHRGIHIHENTDSVKQFMANPTKKRSDFRDLLVHHQKVDENLKEIYRRTAALHKDNMTMQERIEESWKAFERIGGKRPPQHAIAATGAVHTQQEGYATKLAKLSAHKKDLRARADVERHTGDTDLSKGSALHDLKDMRIKAHVKKQVDRAFLMKRMGDPTPIKTSGKFDRFTNTLKVFNKTQRQVERSVKHEARQMTVKTRPGGRSQWDLKPSSSRGGGGEDHREFGETGGRTKRGKTSRGSDVVTYDDALDVGRPRVMRRTESGGGGRGGRGGGGRGGGRGRR